jgi:transposase-like protein
MKTELLPTPRDLTLSQVMKRFSSEVDAREYLEAVRWPNGVVCPHCKNNDQKKVWKIHANTAKKIRPGLYRCAECDKEFTVTVGTIFEDSHIPLSKWLVGFYMMATAKKGVSALWIQQNLGLGSYRTAWMMMHKIRHALKDPAFNEPLDGTLECDETFVNASAANPKDKPKWLAKGYRPGRVQMPVVALVKRDGGIRSRVISLVTQNTLRAFIGSNADCNSIINTDQSPVYKFLRGFKRHDKVNHHVKEYARHNPDGTVSHVNTCESFFSLLKRGVYGSFHHVSREHLPRYCDEFSFRWNHRDLNSGERFVAGLKKAEGKRLTYKTPISHKI